MNKFKVASMLIAMLNSTVILVAIFKYDCVKRTEPFKRFWRLKYTYHILCIVFYYVYIIIIIS